MPAIDSILVSAVNPGAGPAVGTTVPSGDSLSVRNFPDANKAYLQNIVRQGTAAGFVQVRSPLLHDNVQGIRVTPGESPSVFSIPGIALQVAHAQDTYICELSGGAAETDIAILNMYYENLPGATARLHSPADISPLVKNVKPIRVAVVSSATVGQWTDTAITASEDLTHANTDYAVLGYMSNVALGYIAIKGIDTGNLRAGGPGATQELPTTNYFARMSKDTGNPWIPVFNSANKNGTVVSVAAATASVAATVELICVELSQNLPN